MNGNDSHPPDVGQGNFGTEIAGSNSQSLVGFPPYPNAEPYRSTAAATPNGFSSPNPNAAAPSYPSPGFGSQPKDVEGNVGGVREAEAGQKRGFDEGLGEEQGGEDAPKKKWPGWPGDNVFRMVVPVAKVGSIIGRKGEYVKRICEETKARVKIVDGIPGVDERVVLVSGKEDPDSELPPAVVALLRVHRRVVEGMEREMGENEGVQPAEEVRGVNVTTRMLVPATQAGSLIGRQGAVIKQMQDATSAHIRVLPAEEVPRCSLEDDRLVEVSGEYSGVHEAIRQIGLHLRRFLCDHSVLPLFEHHKPLPHAFDPRGPPPPWGAAGGAPPHAQPLAQGPGAGGPSRYEGQEGYPSATSSQLDYYSQPYSQPPLSAASAAATPSASHPFDSVAHLRAAVTKFGREAAIAAMPTTNTVAPVVTQVSATMQIPISYVDAIIGQNGTNIVFIRRTSGASVTIQESRATSGEAEMTIEVRGSAAQVQTAQQLIEGFMNSYTTGTEPTTTAAGGYSSEAAYGRQPYTSDSTLTNNSNIYSTLQYGASGTGSFANY